MDARNDEICLRVPARQSSLIVVRMMLSGVCAQLGADMETIEDVRMAADEACYCLMNQPAAACALSVCCAPKDEGHISVRFAAERAREGGDASRSDPDIARGILETLACEVRLEHDAQGIFEIDLVICPRAV